MPHNFIKVNAVSPNPGLWNRQAVKAICDNHNGTFEYLWFDDPHNPNFAYVLVKDGDVDGILQDLHGQQITRLFDS